MFSVLLLATLALMVAGAPPAESDAATIVNSGSTNFAGFHIVVENAGVARITYTGRKSGRSLDQEREQTAPNQLTLSPDLLARFQADLKAAKPFSSLPEVHCMKSASFGSTLTLSSGGEQTPDLSCGDGGNTAMGNLIRDVNEIVALFHGD